MAERKVAEMHPSFAKWYGDVSMDGEKRLSRWAAIDELVSTSDLSLVEVLIRLAFATKAPPGGIKQENLSEKLAEFYKALVAHDETYEVGAARENQVIAACTLAQLMQSDPVAALAVTTTAAAGARQPNLPMDLVGIAESSIRQHGEARRKRPNLQSLSTRTVDVGFKVDPANLNPASPATFVAPFEELRAASERGIKIMGVRVNGSLESIGSWVQVLDEELQMLWWLVGEHSLDFDVPFSKIDAASQPLTFGKELADNTVGPPGPVAIRALLSRAGLKSKGRIGLVEAVNAFKDDWASRATSDVNISPVSTPIHFALERRVETGAGQAWVAGWAAIADLPEGYHAAPLALGELFYRERLILEFGE